MQADDTSVRIPLRARDGSVRAYAIVDAADADWVNQWRWCLTTRNYVRRAERIDGNKPHTIKLHRALLGLTAVDGVEVDHLNRDPLDNRRSNLRIVDRNANAQNVPGRVGTSKYRGVTWYKARRKWGVQIVSNKKHHFLGLFDSEEEAASVAREGRARLLPFSVD